MAELDMVTPAGSSRGVANNPDVVTVVAKPHMFRSDLIVKHIPYGKRVSEIIDDMDLESPSLQARVLIDETVIEKAYWHRVKPKAGHRLTIRVFPQGGAGGAAGGPGMKDLYRMVAMLGVLAMAVAAPFLVAGLLGAIGIPGASLLASGTLGGSILTMGSMFGGSLNVLALIPQRTTQPLIGEHR